MSRALHSWGSWQRPVLSLQGLRGCCSALTWIYPTFTLALQSSLPGLLLYKSRLELGLPEMGVLCDELVTRGTGNCKGGPRGQVRHLESG